MDRERTQIPDHYDDVGPGWKDILDDLHNEIVELFPNYYVDQIKEKFAGLRAYLSFDSGDLFDPENTELMDKYHRGYAIISKYEQKSHTVCEECGIPGRSVRVHGWYRTLCVECFPEELREYHG